jgi:bcr-type benzoyl-CoA reductase subunit C
MYAPFYETIADPAAVINKHRRDRPVIGVLPAYFPLEVIHAAGGYPVQLWGAGGAGGHADAYLQPYCCSVSRSALESAMRAADPFIQAYVFTSLCDTLINLRELFRRLFAQPILGLFIPMTQSPAERRRLLSEEVAQLLSGLEALSGRRVSGDALRDSARRFGHLRFLQRELYRLRRETPGVIRNADFYAVLKAGFFLPVEEYSPLLENLLTELKSVPTASDRRPKIVLSGMVFDPLDAQALFDTAGVEVVDDDFASGWRSVSKATLSVDDLVDGIAVHLFSGAPCCCIHDPIRDRHDYLVQKVRHARADGVVFWSVKFCEPDAFDRPQLLARLQQEGIATTTVEMDLPMKSVAALQTRIQAFGEMIGGLEI